MNRDEAIILAAHIAVALAEWRKRCARDRVELPSAYHLLAEFFFRFTTVQDGSSFGDWPTCSHDGAVVLLTIPAAAELLSVSTSTVKRLVARGELPSVKIEGARRIHKADLEDYAARLRPGRMADRVEQKVVRPA